MRHLPVILLLLAVLGLAACQTAPPAPPQEAPVEETLSVREYIQRGMGYLEVGDAANARGDFEKALAQDPDNRTAVTLLEQIDADPEEYLGSEHFTYRVRRGQALSVIAQRYLGSSLKFYILARYNNIANPSRIEVGQALKIPGKPRAEPAPAPVEVEEITATTGEPEVPAERTTQQTVPTEVTATEVTPSVPEQADTVLESSELPAESGESVADAAPSSEVAAPTESAAAVPPPSTPPAASAQNNEAERLYQRGTAEYQAGQLEASYASLNQSLRLDPDNASARQQVAQVKPALVDQYHKQALVLYREQQNMCGAIRAWDKVLALEPNHSSALTYQDRAQRIATKVGQECR